MQGGRLKFQETQGTILTDRDRHVQVRLEAGVDTLANLPTLISSVFHLAASKILICTFDDRQSLKCVVAERRRMREGEKKERLAPPRRRRETRGCRVWTDGRTDGRTGGWMDGCRKRVRRAIKFRARTTAPTYSGREALSRVLACTRGTNCLT